MPQYVPKDFILHRLIEKPPPIGCVTAPIGCLAMLVYIVVMIPLIPLWVWRRSRLRSWFAASLAANGRLLSWAHFLARTQTEQGSVIIEVGNKAPTRFWWTRDRVLSLAPVDPPPYSELNIIQYGGADYHPFARWCYENYLSPDSGKASLAFPVEADFETFPFQDDYDEQMRKRFPDQDVAIVTFYDARYA